MEANIAPINEFFFAISEIVTINVVEIAILIK